MTTEDKSVTKLHIINRISQDSGFSQKDSGLVLDLVLNQITESLESGGEVLISGFGKFSVQEKDARLGRNPRTNQPVEISARRVMRFKPSKSLKIALNSTITDPK